MPSHLCRPSLLDFHLAHQQTCYFTTLLSISSAQRLGLLSWDHHPSWSLVLGFSSCCAPARDGSPRPLLFPFFLPVPSHCLDFLFPSGLSLKSCRHERPQCFRPTTGNQSFGNGKNQGDGPCASSQPAVPGRSSAVDPIQLRPPRLNPTEPQ